MFPVVWNYFCFAVFIKNYRWWNDYFLLLIIFSLSLSLVCFLFVILGIGITSSVVGVVVLDSLVFHYHFFLYALVVLSVVGIWVFLSKDRFFSKMKKTPHYPLKEIVEFFCALYPVLYMYSHVTLLGVMAASPLLGFVRRAFECIGRFGNREGKLLVWLLITAFCLMVKMAAFVVVCGFSMLVLLVTTKNLCYFLLFNMEVFKLLLL